MAGTGLVPSTAIPAASWVQSQATVSETADQVLFVQNIGLTFFSAIDICAFFSDAKIIASVMKFFICNQYEILIQYDPNPQTPGPWVAPQPAELNNDMMWHDPNPKQKKVQRDTGTSVWGDPTQQSQVVKNICV